MTQSINPSEYPNDPEQVIVQEFQNQEQDDAAKLKKQVQRRLGKKLSSMLKDAKRQKFGVGGKMSSFRLTKYTESNYDGGARSVMSKASQNSSAQMLATEVSVASDLNHQAKNKNAKQTTKQVQIEGQNLSQYNINQDSQASIELQTQNFQGTLLNLAKRTPTQGTRQSSRLAQPKDPIVFQKKTKQESFVKKLDQHSFNPQNKITLSSTAQDFNKRKLSVQRPRQLAPIQNGANLKTDQSKYGSLRQSPVSSAAFLQRNTPEISNGQWSQNLQFKFNRQQPTLERIRMEQDENEGFGIIDYQDEINSCWEATHFTQKDIRNKKNKSMVMGYTNKSLFPFQIETGVIEEQVKFKAPYTKSINMYKYEEDLSFWDSMTQQNQKFTDNSISALDSAMDYNKSRNPGQSNNTTSRRDVTVGTAHIVSEHSEEESPYHKQNDDKKLKLQIIKTQSRSIVPKPISTTFPKQPYTSNMGSSPAKSPTRYEDSPCSGDYTVDSLGEKRLRNPIQRAASLEREKYEKMVNVVNRRIQQREKSQVDYLNAISKVKKKDVGFDLEYLDDKINKSLMSNAPKFIYVKYQSTLAPQLEKKVQSKINMGSKTRGNKKRKKINFMARNTQMFSSKQLPQVNDQEYKKVKTTLQRNLTQLENQSN